MTVLWVALMGAVGSVARYGAGLLGARLFGGIPAGTFAVNLIGSAAIGFVMSAFAARGALESPARVALTAGLLGGFTTYSAFCYETWVYVERGAYLAAATYIAVTLLACLLGCGIGFWLGRML
jgi:fluoride exporter